MKFNQPSSFYLGIYAGLGVSQTLGFFLMGYCFALLTYYASRDLHRIAIKRVMNAPMSFFETTPLGRIMNRFSKGISKFYPSSRGYAHGPLDIDTIDNLLGDSFRMLIATLTNILGAIILVAIVLPWFLIAVFAIFVFYIWSAVFYRASARELKRLGMPLLHACS